MDAKEIGKLDAVLGLVQEWMFSIIFASMPQTGATMTEAHAARHRLIAEIARQIERKGESDE